jgi:CHAT domain-containing protein
VLYVIPHGPLHYVPFAALHTPSGGPLLQTGGPAIVYAPSATLLARGLGGSPRAAGATLALGYDDRGAMALLLAEREAQLVGHRTGGQVEVGAGAKRTLLTARAPELRWLHIAGHAVYRPEDPMGSYLRLGADDDLDARTIMRSLSLRRALVTLNACTSGLSHVASGDELLGLPRAFLYAGAATIICALHEVDDLAAYTLMVYFVEKLALGASPARALHHAQLRLRDCRRADVERVLAQSFDDGERAAMPSLDWYADAPFAHPRYWASFVVVGSP